MNILEYITLDFKILSLSYATKYFSQIQILRSVINVFESKFIKKKITLNSTVSSCVLLNISRIVIFTKNIS